MEPKKQQKAHMLISDEIFRLAADIDSFSYDYDTYGYWDDVENAEENVLRIADEIAQGDTSGLKEYLQEIIAECRVQEYVKRAKTLLRRVNRLGRKKETAD